MPTQAEKAARFVALHQQCFIAPNPWDLGSARLLESMGFQALATSSAGLAWTRGGADLSVARPAMMAYLRELCAATTLPVSADLQNGYADAPELVHDCIVEAAATGVVGASIEDAGGDGASPIYDTGLAVERIRAAAQAARSLDFPFTLTARAENYLHGKPDLDDTIRRLQAYQEAGADVLFAPGLTKAADIRAVAGALERPLNVIMGLPNMQLTMRQLEELGVRRVSVGGSLAKVAYDALMRAGREILERGSFDYAQTALSSRDINAIMSRP
ncbi:oxaloacetate decarboxylase [Rugamonas sp. CCM 8940]|uniref:isocitrate lyase/PEP mutase family protein n=1 Tax=Rugamonas sp. CCM 8940 TaxID=2765359 RepID=UPI0018F348DB|nr:isocitrate lyase/phosphoenolpyruvate mutase family protein [Rugamonas sp. CCM 8940]MBJ7312197.1 isocitrate lyase/phosphoenolpyruvate mutase family protein [Rugamonas sp. CCM 8940]